MILKRTEYPPKETLETLIKQNLTNEEMSHKLGISIYKLKFALIEYGLFVGKKYSYICEGCGKPFYHFVKGYKFCSNSCKHKYQLIWNKNKTKYNDKRIEKLSNFALGNTWSINKTEKLIKLILPNTGIVTNYNSNSNTEKTFLLSLDNSKDLVDVKRCDIIIPYKDKESNKKRHHTPDFIVSWKTGLKWLVEIKGILQLHELDKISAAQLYAEENGMRYKLITKGLVKYNMWDKFYYHTMNFNIPSKEYVSMANTVMISQFSCSNTRRVGCMILTENYNNILSYGYNGDEKDGPNISSSSESGKSGFIHAEENALIKQHSKENAVMFLTDSPCEMCAKKIVNAGNIKEVYYLREYRDMSGVGLLISHGIKTYKFQLLDNRLTPISDELAYQKFLPAGFVDEMSLENRKI